MPSWRTSTWVYLAAVVATVVAEVIYATSDDPTTQSHQGNALAYLIILTVVFAIYRGLTRGRRSASST
jgi:hypothetical protein